MMINQHTGCSSGGRKSTENARQHKGIAGSLQ
jgi:hypothetical protein